MFYLRKTLLPRYRSRIIIAAFGFVAAFFIHSAAPAYAAASVVFDFSTSVTGTAPFTPGDNSPGNDANASNNIVRTLDQVRYQWDYAVNDETAENVVLTATLSPDQEWQSIPPACLSGSGITINPSTDAQTLTCLLGNVNSGSNGFISASARVVGQRPDGSFVGNGDIVEGIGTFASDTSPSYQSATVETIVSAAPKADLRKNRTARVIGVRTGRDGSTQGVVVRYPLAIIVNSGKGSEPLTGNISITDTLLGDLDNDGSAETPVPGAELYDWENATRRGCAWNNEPGQGINEWYLPVGNLSRDPARPERSVADSGTWSCSQAGGPSTAITINITGADTTGNHVPTQSRNGATLPVNEAYLVTGAINIWIPTQLVLDNGGDLKLTNRYSPLNNLSVSNQVNQDPTTPNTANDPDNNTRTFTLVAGRGSFNQYYASSITSRGSVLFPMAARNSGDGSVMPGQNFAKRLIGINNGILDWQDYRYCEKFDSQVLRLEPIPGDATTAVRVFNNNVYGYVIEYGTGDENGNPGTYSSYTAMRTATCNDSESADGWITDMNAVVGGPDTITKIRFRATEPLPPNANMDLAVNFVARNYYPGTTDRIPNGTLLPNMSAYSTPTLAASTNNNSVAGNGWYYGSYNPVNHGGSKAFGDRLFLTRAIVRIQKETVPNDSVDSISTSDEIDPGTGEANNVVTFLLRSSVTATIDPAPTQPDVIVRDILPAELAYNSASANLPPTSITINPDGTTTLVWNLGPQIPNDPVSDITFKATANFDVSDGTQAINTAIIESPDDGSDESTRTARRTITIGNAAAFGIVKAVPNEFVEPDNPFTYELNYANTGSIDVGVGDFIDILPYLNDGRSPNTSYNGSLAFVNVTGSNGETFQYTQASPTSMSLDPQDPTNQPGGSTVWCSAFSGGTCPASAADVTGIRIATPVFPEGTPTRTVVVALSATGNQPDDIYTNIYGGRVDGLIGVLESNAVPVTTRFRSNLLLVKRITAINTQPITSVINDLNDSDDDDPNWPNGYLQGEILDDSVVPSDEVEYTIYFLSNGISNVYNINLCDLIPEHTTFINNAYAGLTPMEGNNLSSNRLSIALSNLPIGLRYLTDSADSDSGTFFGPGLPSSASCIAANTNGAVVVNVPQISHTGPGGSPQAAYGFIRFKVFVQ